MKYMKLFEAWMRPVIKFDVDGNYIEEYECVGDAAKDNGLDRSMSSFMDDEFTKIKNGFIYRYNDYYSKDLRNMKDGKSNLYNTPTISGNIAKKPEKKVSKTNTIMNSEKEYDGFKLKLGSDASSILIKFDSEPWRPLSKSINRLSDHNVYLTCRYIISHKSIIPEWHYNRLIRIIDDEFKQRESNKKK